MATDERKGERGALEPKPSDSPFELPAIEGIPFDRDSEEAQAIRRVIEEAERERAAQAQS